MQQQATEPMAKGGREASRQRRKQIVKGKTGMPPATERTRITAHEDDTVRSTLPSASVPAPVSIPAPAAAPAPAPVAAPVVPAAPATSAAAMPAGGRDASRVRRQQIVKGKSGMPVAKERTRVTAREDDTVRSTLNPAPVSAAQPVATATPEPMDTATQTADVTPPVIPGKAGSCLSGGRVVAQAMRALRASQGRGDDEAARATGRVRNTDALKYAPKVETTRTYGAQNVTGVRIGRGVNVTGNEPGTDKPISGTQYIAADGSGAYRLPGTKVGASRTENGQVVTGSQVRSQVKITGDEANDGIRITGEADQTLGDDVIERGDGGFSVAAQFQRQNNPHGASVFGTNLGRSVRSVGSRERDMDDGVTEMSLGGHQISGTAVGRSPIVTGDEDGSCRSITGSQYLRAGEDQPLCSCGASHAPTPTLQRFGRMQARGETETWERQRITGVDVEHVPGVTGDEQGTCSPITGTPYAGPAQYETYCDEDMNEQAACRVSSEAAGRPQITGDIPLHAEGVTGTDRGAENDITGTPYFRQGGESAEVQEIATVTDSFSIRTPQREAQMTSARDNSITGSFAVGTGKITGNHEFDYAQRWQGNRPDSATQVTGEGRVQGPAITGSAWDVHDKVTGTEGATSGGRNPSERAGQKQAFAGAGQFKGQGKETVSEHHVTGMVGWSPKTAARVTLSGGAQG